MLLIIGGAILGVLLLGFAYEQAARRRERGYALPGRMVTVGGSRLHVTVMGQGGPAVVLIHGAGWMPSCRPLGRSESRMLSSRSLVTCRLSC
jgi:hypothetical protein